MKISRPDRSAPERRPSRVELTRNGLVADDRARDELRKERDIERNVDGVAVRPEPPAVDVDDVGKAVKGEERDAEGELDVGLAEVPAQRLEQGGKISGDEIGVFEDPEHQKIDGNREA